MRFIFYNQNKMVTEYVRMRTLGLDLIFNYYKYNLDIRRFKIRIFC